MKVGEWQPWQAQELIDMWESHRVVEIAGAVQKSRQAVYAKAYNLRKHDHALPGHQRSSTNWTEAQIEVIRHYWDLEPYEDTAARVGHSVEGCKRKVYEVFGSTHRRKWDEWERNVNV